MIYIFFNDVFFSKSTISNPFELTFGLTAPTVKAPIVGVSPSSGYDAWSFKIYTNNKMYRLGV